MAKIILKKPIKDGDRLITELDIDEPTLGDIEASSKVMQKENNEIAAMMALLANHTGLSMDVIRRIPASDIKKIRAVLDPLFSELGETGADSPPTSPTPSTSA
ncbi:MAG: phage tail assembly protein [Methylobacteriaceae bacterium]|nr:phage tail assembly protein [Methylobacteriaceae bacterium]